MNGGKDHYRDGVEKLLYQFGQKGLKAADVYIDEGKQLGQKVFNTLQKHSKQSVAKVHFAGSIGKKTEVVEPDLDLVVVLNDCDPPFDSALDDFENILILFQDKLQIIPESIERKTSFSIQFVFTNGIEVDLLPAANMEPKEIYELLKNKPKDYYNYSSSLVGRQLTFMKSHSSSFLHIVIRLAKFWFKSLNFGERKVYGGSTMMELMGIAAAEKEEATHESPSVLRALADVINMACKLNTLKLAFEEVSDGKWERVPENQLRPGLIPGVVGTADLLNRKYFIIEPANPYNDLLGDKEESLQKFMGFAKVTRDRLDKLMAGQYATYNGDTNVMEIDISKIFEPQPCNLKATFPSGAPPDFQITYCKPYSSLSCGMTVRNDEPLKRTEVKLMVEALKKNLFTTINVTVEAASGNITFVDVKNAVDNLIKQNLVTDLMTADRDREEEMDVTLSVPYIIKDQRYAVRLSMSWK